MTGILMAAPLFDEAVPRLTLKDGTFLQDAQIKGYLTKVVMVKHRDGARTVPYELFPDEYQAVLAARRPVRHDEPAPAPVKEAPIASGKAPAVSRNADLRHGCGFSVVTVNGDIVTMEFRNQSSAPVRVHPGMFVARTYSGEMLPGMQWVGLDSAGRVSVILTRWQLIAPGDVVTLQLMVAPMPHESAIDTVQWRD